VCEFGNVVSAANRHVVGRFHEDIIAFNLWSFPPPHRVIWLLLPFIQSQFNADAMVMSVALDLYGVFTKTRVGLSGLKTNYLTIIAGDNRSYIPYIVDVSR